MKTILFFQAFLAIALATDASGQITKGKFGNGGTVDRSILPDHVANSDGLILGGEFADLIKPLPARANRVAPKWGTEGSRVRDAWYGIEDDEYSYWGGNVILGDDGQYHCFVARWPEDTPKGHFDWNKSTVAHAVSDNPLGPWKVLGEAYPEIRKGRGHNPEVRRLKDGTWSLALNAHLLMKTEGTDINGKWIDTGKISQHPDWHELVLHNANPSFTNPRADGSLVYSSRLGSIGVVPDGDPNSDIQGIQPRMYPTYEGGPEDPVIWKTGHQYHLILNYWKVRLAVKLRSHDGVNWELDPGVAYTQLAEKYTDGTVVDWYKAERPKVTQDEHGRATHLSVAFIDVIKYEDLSDDNHSSKHITFPLVVEGLTQILNKDMMTDATDDVRIKLIAEDGFDPHKDVDVSSLVFGDPKAVNYGRGMRATEAKADGKDLIVTFRRGLANGSGITENSFTGKILGKRTDGTVYYAYPRLPGFVDDPAMLTLSPIRAAGNSVEFTVKNFGLEASKPTALKVNYPGETIQVPVPILKPYEQKSYSIEVAKTLEPKDLKKVRGEFTPRYQAHGK